MLFGILTDIIDLTDEMVSKTVSSDRPERTKTRVTRGGRTTRLILAFLRRGFELIITESASQLFLFTSYVIVTFYQSQNMNVICERDRNCVLINLETISPVKNFNDTSCVRSMMFVRYQTTPFLLIQLFSYSTFLFNVFRKSNFVISKSDEQKPLF